jgi:hypothetical protein
VNGGGQLWPKLRRRIDDLAVRCGELILHISIGKQRGELVTPQGISRIYVLSTGRNPPSCVEWSHGTPLGCHVVAEKYGDGLEPGSVLVGRRPTGKFFWEFDDWRTRGYVTTRILRLAGLEKGINSGTDGSGRCCDSFKRYIYLHGTCFEEKLGSPNSNGCIVLSNVEIVDLFGRCPVGTPVIIDI